MFPFETSPCRGLLLFPGLPPAKGYLSFETPLAIGKSELTRSELETSRVVSTWIELAASKVRSLLGAATLLNLHTVRFSRSESREVFARRSVLVCQPFETSPARHSSSRLHTATGRRSLLGD